MSACCASTRTLPPRPGGATGARRRRCRGVRPAGASAPRGRPAGRRSASTRRRDRRRRPKTSAGVQRCGAATTRPAWTTSRRRPTARSGPLAVRARRSWPQRSELDAVDRRRLLAGDEERAEVHVVDVVVHRQGHVAGSRPTQMYVTVGSFGIPSSGVWVLMKRRCVWACRSANTSVQERVTMSIHGESMSNGSGSSGSCRMSDRADHLRPRRPALRRRADDDVARGRPEAVPAVAVVDGRLVATHERHCRSGLDP